MIRRGRNKRLVTRAVLGLFLLTLSGAGIAQSCVGAQPLTTASETVSIKAVGDIVLGSNWPTSYYPPGFEAQVQTQLKEILGDADAMFGNFEGALTTHAVSTKNTRSGSMFAFRMPPHFARLLESAGFNVLHISNNHTFDFGETGFNDTITHLADAGILTDAAQYWRRVCTTSSAVIGSCRARSHCGLPHNVSAIGVGTAAVRYRSA